MTKKNKTLPIGFGGGCHWCTEAVFQSIIGVEKVEQGFIASTDENKTFSEAVIVYYDPNLVSLDIFIEIHLETHKSSSDHSMRNKYRSAIYTFSAKQQEDVENRLEKYQEAAEKKIITQAMPFGEFKASDSMFQNYYQSNPEKPFCKTYIDPKITLLLEKFQEYVNTERIYL